MVVGVEGQAAREGLLVLEPVLDLLAPHRPARHEGGRVREDARRPQVGADARVGEGPLEPRPVEALLLAASHEEEVGRRGS